MFVMAGISERKKRVSQGIIESARGTSPEKEKKIFVSHERVKQLVEEIKVPPLKVLKEKK